MLADLRSAKRTSSSDLGIPLRAQLFCGQEFIDTQVVNFNFQGLCLLVEGDKENVDFSEIGVFLSGELILKTTEFKVIWRRKAEIGFMLGIGLTAAENPIVERRTRMEAKELVAPSIECADPTDPNRQLYFRVLDVSKGGLKVVTSLSNRSLMRGMHLGGARLHFPGSGPIECGFEIRWIRMEGAAGAQELTLGLKAIEVTAEFLAAAARYSIVFAKFDILRERLQGLRENEFPFRELRFALTYRVVLNAVDYSDVLKLRFEGYRAHNKVPEGFSESDMGEGLKTEGIVLSAYLHGNCVASCEIRLRGIHSGLKHEKFLDSAQLKKLVDVDFVAEVNRLVVTPELQGTDIVVGLVQRIQAVLFCNGERDLVISATNELRPFYLRMGFKDSGLAFPHPTLAGVALNILCMPKAVYIASEGISPAKWKQLFSSITNFMKAADPAVLAEPIPKAG